MEVSPIPSEPALLLRREKTLVLADLHLGLESELSAKGVCLPSQIPEIKQRVLQLIKIHKAEKLLLLGDVKHNVPRSTWLEWRELPGFFEELLKAVEVEIIPGNHDGDLEGMIPRGVKIHPVSGIRLGKVGFVHGHAWPSKEVLGGEVLVMGHNHPAVELRERVGGKMLEPAWLRLRMDPSHLPPALRTENPPEVLVMPSFSRLIKGSPVNREVPEELIGPLFRSGALSMEKAEVYLLDGTYLGRVTELCEI
ncbi:MAG: metallophosphoesterase [Candidatus Hadarchaeales archaeon]